MGVSVVLNGRLTVLDCAPATMLLEALREGEGLTSVRATCGIGVCGACTVLLDGEPVSGCLTMAGHAEGRRARQARLRAPVRYDLRRPYCPPQWRPLAPARGR